VKWSKLHTFVSNLRSQSKLKASISTPTWRQASIRARARLYGSGEQCWYMHYVVSTHDLSIRPCCSFLSKSTCLLFPSELEILLQIFDIINFPVDVSSSQSYRCFHPSFNDVNTYLTFKKWLWVELSQVCAIAHAIRPLAFYIRKMCFRLLVRKKLATSNLYLVGNTILSGGA